MCSDRSILSKVVLVAGEWGTKPMEASECKIRVGGCSDGGLLQYNDSLVVIGDSENKFKRILSKCLLTMNSKEVAKFTIEEKTNNLTFTLELIELKFHGAIYEWSAERKMELTKRHKEKGVELFKLKHYKDSAYCFTKALKILSSIPIDAEKPPKIIDNVVTVDEINLLKANLYSNLASFYLKHNKWQMVIDLCNKVFIYEKNNVKAHYKMALAQMNEKNFDTAEYHLKHVLNFEPNNLAAKENLKSVQDEIRKANVNYNNIVRKMFQ